MAADGLRDASARGLGALRHRSRRGARLARVVWRRSLLLRVVTATVTMGVIVLLVVGQLLLQRIADDLVSSASQEAQNNATQQITNTLASLEGQKLDDEQDLRTWVRQKMNDLHGPADAPLRYVALLKELGTQPGPVPDQGLGIGAGSIPMSLRQQVADNQGQLMIQELTLPIRGSDNASSLQRVTAVGSLIDLGQLGAGAEETTGRYELYFVYPLTREVAILAAVQRTFLVGAVALLVLIGLVAWVVTRQVVAPVRATAGVAEQLAAGHLDRRVPVRGDDELARLGRAFNEMAAGLEHQINQLEELSRVQRRFVSDVSHELRTPLTTMRMAGEVLFEGRGALDPIMSRTAELLQAQLDRFESLLSDLLEVSRVDAGAADLEAGQADLREVIAAALEHLVPVAEGRGSAMRVDLPAEPVMAEVDARRVERVVRNLVANAIEHGEGRPIEVRLVAAQDAVAVGVRDHGVGLSTEERRMVFDRFWRADPARARTLGGTGLGLAISLEYAHMHGGGLDVWGEPGRGAHFRLTLPRRLGQPYDDSPLPLEPVKPSPTPKGELAGAESS